MAVTFDYSKLPMNITIANAATVALATDAGTRKVFEVIPVDDMIAGEEFTPVAFDSTGALEYVQVARKYLNTDRKVQFYMTNVTKTLHAGESMTVVATTSAAVAHYMAYADVEGMTAEVATTESGDKAPVTPPATGDDGKGTGSTEDEIC